MKASISQSALHYARSVGGPALRAMSFAERGAVLKAIADAIQAEREALLELAIAERRQHAHGREVRRRRRHRHAARVRRYSSNSRRGHVSGGRRGNSARPRQRASTASTSGSPPRRGGARERVQLPGLGVRGEGGVALLAGMPVLSKPATATAIVATASCELVVEERLPEGALSFLVRRRRRPARPPRPQDVLAFTGSARHRSEACALQANIIEHAVRVNVEADSLNAAVLGPDVEPGSDMYELFLRDVVRDMTQKAGQKCTAIRRVLVRTTYCDDVERISSSCSADPRRRPARSRTRAWARSRAARNSPTCAKACSASAGRASPSAALRPAPSTKGFFISPVSRSKDAGDVVARARGVRPRRFAAAGPRIAGREIVARGNGRPRVVERTRDDQEFIESMVPSSRPTTAACSSAILRSSSRPGRAPFCRSSCTAAPAAPAAARSSAGRAASPSTCSASRWRARALLSRRF